MLKTLVQTGYAIFRADKGSVVPASVALLRTANAEGVLVSETTIPTVRPSRSGLIYVDELETRTGLSFVNPTDQSATLTLFLRDAVGKEIARRGLSVGPHHQLSQFTAQFLGASASNVRGSLVFESDQPIAVAGLRQNLNDKGETIYTAIPVIDTDSSVNAPAIIPYLRLGDGYSTTLILLNRSDQRARGVIQLAREPVTATPYDLPGNAIQRMDLTNSGPYTGHVEVVAEPDTMTPAAIALVQLKSETGVFGETILPAVAPSPAARTSLKAGNANSTECREPK